MLANLPLIGLILLSLLSSCNPIAPCLSVQMGYLSHENLASYYVGTPDPRLNNPPIGQRLIVNWSLPKTYLSTYSDLHLELYIRFGNRQEIVERIAVCKKQGTYMYLLLNEDYCAKKGILTYKLDLIGDGCILKEWRHQIWTELIELTSNSGTEGEAGIEEREAEAGAGIEEKETKEAEAGIEREEKDEIEKKNEEFGEKDYGLD
jgi:hypothetical protein